MNAKKLKRMLLLVCVLVGLMLTTGALTAVSYAEETGYPAILLNGQPVEEAVLNLSLGNTLQFTSDQPVTWKSSKDYRGDIDQNGLLTCISPSTIYISATNAAGQKTSCEVVMARLVTNMTITGATELAGGTRGNVRVTVEPSNAANKKVNWSSSDPSVVTVNSSGRLTAQKIEGTKSAVITATARDGSGVVAQHTVTVKPAAKSVSIFENGQAVSTVYIDISSENPTKQLSAAVYPADACQHINWKTSSSRTVSVDENGLITGKRTGNATITATADDGTGRKTTVKVKVVRMVKEIEITGSSSVLAGKRISLGKEITPSNATDRDVTWTSSDPSIATVDSRGRVTAKKVDGLRSVVITATAEDGSGVSDQHTVWVTPAIESMQITANEQVLGSSLTIDIGSNPVVDLGTLIMPLDACQDVAWKSSSTRRATVDANGVVTAKRTGSVKITATAQDGSNKKVTLNVSIGYAVKGIEITGSSSVLAGKRISLGTEITPSNATNKKVTWTSSDPSIATVDSRGRVTAKKVDGLRSVVITATAQDGSGVTAQHAVNVTPAISSMQITADEQVVSSKLVIDMASDPTVDLGTLIMPLDACQDVTWKTSSTRYATVDENGLLTAKRTGSVKITATSKDGGGKKTTINVSIINAVKSITLSGDQGVAAGKRGSLSASVEPSNATNKKVTWTSSNPSVLSVDSRGRITAAKSIDQVYNVTITATAQDGSGVSGSIVVAVTPRANDVTIMKDGQSVGELTIDLSHTPQVQLTAKVNPDAAYQGVTWSSSNKRYATVDANGVVTGLRNGKVTITATAADGTGVYDRMTLNMGTTVKQIVITGSHDVSAISSTDLDAQVVPSGASNTGVVWTSSDPSIAWVNEYGVVKANPVEAPTQVTITATAADGAGAVCDYVMTVRPVTQSLSIYRKDAGMATTLILDKNGGQAHLGVNVTPATASQNVRWSSSNSSVVSVDSNGVVTAHRSGQAVITAYARDGSDVKTKLTVGVGDAAQMPYYIEVDYANHVVRIYERGEDGSYSKLIKRMISSMGLKPSYGLDFGLYRMDGGHLKWMSGIVMYATRIEGPVYFHSVKYHSSRPDDLYVEEYAKLGSPASAGCFRLLTVDAKWIYDNVPDNTYVRWMRGTRDISEYGAVKAPELKGGKWDPTNPDPNNPDYDPTYTSDVK